MRSGTLSVKARYVFPVEGEPIAGGIVRIIDSRIAEVCPATARGADLDLGNVAIAPGFVNAHTHLDLEAMGTSGAPPWDLIDWLKLVIAERRKRTRAESAAAVVRNLAASIHAGTTLVADTTVEGVSWPHIALAPIRAVVFSELIGLRRERAMQSSQTAFEWLGKIGPDEQIAACARPGLSPHAPYSTAGWLFQRAADTALPLSTHLAELPDERELLSSLGGRLRNFLEEIGAWDPDWSPIGPTPADYVRRGSLRNSDWLIAHGTYFDPLEYWQFLPKSAPNGQRVAIVYCPRTHARFGHAAHPYRELLDRGAIVCLGTDSLASNPNLSIFDEMRFLHDSNRGEMGRRILCMGTLWGAWALRAETVTGSLKTGKCADMAIVRLPDRESSDPYALLFDRESSVAGTMFEGRFVHGPWRV